LFPVLEVELFFRLFSISSISLLLPVIPTISQGLEPLKGIFAVINWQRPIIQVTPKLVAKVHLILCNMVLYKSLLIMEY